MFILKPIPLIPCFYFFIIIIIIIFAYYIYILSLLLRNLCQHFICCHPVPPVMINLEYKCDECQYSSCDVTCGIGERRGVKHCVMYNDDLTTIIDEHDARCPPLTCSVECVDPTTPAVTTTIDPLVNCKNR